VFTQHEIDQSDRVVVISQAFAEINDLSVGSIIEFENIAHDYRIMGFEGSGNFILDRHEERFMLAQRTLEFEVIGIFDLEHELTYEGYEGSIFAGILSGRAELNNRIYMPIGVAEDLLNFQRVAMIDVEDELRDLFGDHQADEWTAEEPWLESIFILNDPRDLDEFSAAAEELLPGFWEIRDLRGVQHHIIASMDNILQIADFIVWAAAGTMIISLTLIIVLFLRDRRHEMGIYLALGDRKGKLVSQVLIETLLITMLSITLSLFVGSLLSQNISRNMFERNMIEQQQSYNEDFEISWELILFNPGELAVEEALELYNVSLGFDTVLLIVLASSITILLSTAIPVAYVVKLEPKELLM